MTGLSIFLGIIAFILLLLMCPFKVSVEYEEEVKVTLGYLFLKFAVVPKKPKKKKKKKSRKAGKSKKDNTPANKNAEKNQDSTPEKDSEQKKQKVKPKKKNPILEYKDKHGLDGLIDLIKVIVGIVVNVLKKTAKQLVITDLVINAMIVGEDSADTALKYGYACSGIYPAVSLLQSNAKLKKHSEDISAGFLAEKTAVELRLKARIRVIFLLCIAVAALWKLIVTVVKKEMHK